MEEKHTQLPSILRPLAQYILDQVDRSHILGKIGGGRFISREVLRDLPAHAPTHEAGGSDEVDSFDDITVSGAAEFGDSGGWYIGSGTFATPTTGIRLEVETGTPILAGFNAGVQVWWADPSGIRIKDGYDLKFISVLGAVLATLDSSIATWPAFKSSGLTGATAASRYVGATVSGAPIAGTFAVGDFVIAQDGSIWICTSAGSPGVWTQAGGAVDAADVTYTPAVNADWDGSADPGDLDDALDQLAERISDVETVPPGDRHVIQDEGTDQAARANLNFVGAGVTVTDDAGNDATLVTIPGGGAGSPALNVYMYQTFR